jgi:hypothetical protein
MQSSPGGVGENQYFCRAEGVGARSTYDRLQPTAQHEYLETALPQ